MMSHNEKYRTVSLKAERMIEDSNQKKDKIANATVNAIALLKEKPEYIKLQIVKNEVLLVKQHEYALNILRSEFGDFDVKKVSRKLMLNGIFSKHIIMLTIIIIMNIIHTNLFNILFDLAFPGARETEHLLVISMFGFSFIISLLCVMMPICLYVETLKFRFFKV